MNTPLKIIITADGSHSLYNKELEEVYHSKNGAIAESQHVFLEAGFRAITGLFQTIRILEVGYGTGLNAFLTSIASYESDIRVEYVGIEPFPVNSQILEELNYGVQSRAGYNWLWEEFKVIEKKNWKSIHPGFKIKVVNQTLEKTELSKQSFHLIYFDAFAPAIQPEMWTDLVFNKLFDVLKTNGVLVTYSAKGSVRRSLQSAGFTVERIPGPAGKREMLRAIKPG